MFLGFLVAAAALAGAAYGCFRQAWLQDGFTSFAWGVGGLVAAVLGLMFVISAFGASGHGVCPGCGDRIGAIPPSVTKEQFFPCEKCRRYVRQQKDALTLVPDDFVSPELVFKTKLPERFRWAGDGCVVCLAPSTKRQETKIKVSKTASNAAASAAGLAMGGLIGVGFIRTGGETEYTLEVPHCDAHQDGARLDEDGGLVILFRSYPYLRAFCAANDLTPEA